MLLLIVILFVVRDFFVVRINFNKLKVQMPSSYICMSALSRVADEQVIFLTPLYNLKMDAINTQSLNKVDLNFLILNYLIIEGYETAASNFAKESGIKEPQIEGLKLINQRNEIKLMLIKGEINEVIKKLNEYFPFLLEKNDFLYFKILMLNLIEIIKKHQKEKGKESGGKTKRRSSSRRKSSVGRVNSISRKSMNDEDYIKEEQFFNTIIMFIKEKLFDKAIKNKTFLQELELTMCLLLFDFHDFQNNLDALPKELMSLINNTGLKNEVFNLINNSILSYKSNYLSNSSTQGDFERIDEVGFILDSDEDADEVEQEEEEEQEEAKEDEKLENKQDLSFVNSKLKQLVNLWIWGENELQDKNIPRIDLTSL